MWFYLLSLYFRALLAPHCIVFLQLLICYYGKSIVYNGTLSAKCGLIISGSAIVDSSLTVNCSLLLPDINCRHKLLFETYYFLNKEADCSSFIEAALTSIDYCVCDICVLHMFTSMSEHI